MNIVDIEYSEQPFKERANEALVISRINKILNRVNKKDVELSVSFVSDEEIRELNHQWRNLDKPTDILSFVQGDVKDEDSFWPSFDDETEPVILGDMVISLSALDRNCEYFKVTFDEELYRLLIHGVLHLIGYDHKSNDKEEPMLMLQEEILLEMRETE